VNRLKDTNAVARNHRPHRRMGWAIPAWQEVGHNVREIASTMPRAIRIYYVQRGAQIMIRCVAGQAPETADIEKAQKLAEQCNAKDLQSRSQNGYQDNTIDAADYLNTEERQAAYIAAALEPACKFVRDALARRSVRAWRDREEGRLEREESVQGSWEAGNPELATVMRIVGALGLTCRAARGSGAIKAPPGCVRCLSADPRPANYTCLPAAE